MAVALLRFRAFAAVLFVMVLTGSLGGAAGAAPAPPTGENLARSVALGGGAYQVIATVWGDGTDGQVGGTTSSGYVLQANDSAVAMPACTQSSCPWYPLGTGTDGEFGPQTTCAEADGLCWVELVSVNTGGCTVAPIRDRGPTFIKDNWWAPQSERTYPLEQGVPAAEAALAGADLGYGPGVSDVGIDIPNDFPLATAIDIAAGSWQAMGLDVGLGTTTVQVTMLWQAGINHGSACGGSANLPPGDDGGGDDGGPAPTGGENATTTTSLNLRAWASMEADVLTVMPSGSRVAVTGGAENGYYPVTYGGTSGYAAGDYLSFDDGAPSPSDGSGDGGGPAPTGDTATVSSLLNLRSGPSYDAEILDVMPAGAAVTLTGGSENGFVSVAYNGQDGWALADLLSSGGTGGDDTGGGSPTGDTATTTTALNLRAWASTDADVLTVMPAGATVTLTGGSENGFLAVEYNGQAGWASQDYLTG